MVLPVVELEARFGGTYYHEQLDQADEKLVTSLRACIAAQRAAVAHRPPSLPSDPDGLRRVSEEALDAALTSGIDVSDVKTDTELSNCLVFNTGGLPGSVLDPEVDRRRGGVDALVGERLRGLFAGGSELSVATSGHFWYPPGSYMGWHTNRRVPGWRAYVTWAEEPKKSFFRYRDAVTHEVVTSWDEGCDLRLFFIDPARPLWHAVYSETNRYSFGYRVLSSRPSRNEATHHVSWTRGSWK